MQISSYWITHILFCKQLYCRSILIETSNSVTAPSQKPKPLYPGHLDRLPFVISFPPSPLLQDNFLKLAHIEFLFSDPLGPPTSRWCVPLTGFSVMFKCSN